MTRPAQRPMVMRHVGGLGHLEVDRGALPEGGVRGPACVFAVPG